VVRVTNKCTAWTSVLFIPLNPKTHVLTTRPQRNKFKVEILCCFNGLLQMLINKVEVIDKF
jgi:hypothetical protein